MKVGKLYKIERKYQEDEDYCPFKNELFLFLYVEEPNPDLNPSIRAGGNWKWYWFLDKSSKKFRISSIFTDFIEYKK